MAHPIRPQVIPPGTRFPRWTFWLRNIGWRGRVTLLVTLLYACFVIAPAVTATTLHRQTASFLTAWLDSPDQGLSVRLYETATATVVQLPLGDYLVGVLAAEMNPTAPRAALQATAVAARTYAVHALAASGQHPPTYAATHHADITDAGAIDLPYLSMAAQEQRFGSHLDVDRTRLEEAVLATAGQVLTYQDKPILAFIFRISPGQTRSASTVFQKSIPYLPSVACPDDVPAARQAPAKLAPSTLKQALQIPDKSLQLGDFKVVHRDPWSFVGSVQYHKFSWSGQEFADKLGLPSADFTLQVQDGQLVAQSEGVGSDIGMSLHEATALATAGKSAAAILSYFYPGTRWTSTARVFS